MRPVLKGEELTIGATAALEGGNYFGYRGVFRLQHSLEGALCRILEAESVAFDPDVRAQQRHQPIGLVCLRIFHAADPECTDVEESDNGRKHAFPVKRAVQ